MIKSLLQHNAIFTDVTKNISNLDNLVKIYASTAKEDSGLQLLSTLPKTYDLLNKYTQYTKSNNLYEGNVRKMLSDHRDILSNQIVKFLVARKNFRLTQNNVLDKESNKNKLVRINDRNENEKTL